MLRARELADAANERLGAALRARDLDEARLAHAQLERAHAHELELVRATARAREHALRDLLANRAAFEASTHEQLARRMPNDAPRVAHAVEFVKRVEAAVHALAQC